MCTLWVDGFHGIAEHISSRLNFAVIAQAPIEELAAWGTSRDWHNLRLLSSAGSTLKTDLKFQDDDGDQYPGVSVFVRSEDGTLRHFYSASAIMGEDEFRGIDLQSPIWHLQDITPVDREEWYPAVTYYPRLIIRAAERLSGTDPRARGAQDVQNYDGPLWTAHPGAG